jgi:hypothetical protein
MKISLPAAGLLFLTWAGVAFAQGAPWCVSTQALPPQCMFYDPRQCQLVAGQQGGLCVPNGNVHAVRSQLGQYCLVVAGATPACNYVDEGTCAREAKQQGGACVLSSEPTGPNLAPNPYHQVTPSLAGTGCNAPPSINAATSLETACSNNPTGAPAPGPNPAGNPSGGNGTP